MGVLAVERKGFEPVNEDERLMLAIVADRTALVVLSGRLKVNAYGVRH